MFASLFGTQTSGGSYQKNAFVAGTVQEDVSTIAAPKATVSVYSTADVAPNNPWGYVWAGVFIATLDQKSSGCATGMAVGIQNYSAQAVDLMVKGMTIGETIASSGNASTSAALVVLAGNLQFLNGLVVNQDSVVDDAFELRTPAGVEIAAIREDGTEISRKQIIGPRPWARS